MRITSTLVGSAMGFRLSIFALMRFRQSQEAEGFTRFYCHPPNLRPTGTCPLNTLFVLHFRHKTKELRFNAMRIFERPCRPFEETLCKPQCTVRDISEPCSLPVSPILACLLSASTRTRSA